MAKQIYIDGNGNEQLVSGTINNAEMLPIQSGSATDTKSYIDSGLSGKQAKIKQTTLNTTTTSAGLVNLGKKTSDGEYVLSVTAVTNYGGYYCTLSLTTSGEWYANVKQVSDNSSVNNASVAIKVVWCEI
jgi:hypothetical protein